MITRDEIISNAADHYRNSGKLDIVKLASEIGIEVFSSDIKEDDDVSARITIESGKPLILVNEEETVPRQRFSIAHEIAHYVLHQDALNEQGLLNRSKKPVFNKTMEQQADELAAQILMPESIVLPYIEKIGIQKDNKCTPTNIKKIANHFNVSSLVAILRLRSLDYYVPYISLS